MVLPMCLLLPTSSHLLQGGCFTGEESAVEKTQQLIPWNRKRWSGVPCAGDTEVWQLRESLLVSLATTCTTQPPVPVGLSWLWTLVLAAKAAAPGRVCSSHQSLRLKAELPCASAAITSPPSLQPQGAGSVRGTSPLLMCVDEMPSPVLPPALTHQPMPHLQVSCPGHDGGERPALTPSSYRPPCQA